MSRQRRFEQRPRAELLERREFLKGITLLGGLTFISAFLPSCLRKEEPAPEPPAPTTSTEPFEPASEEIPPTKISLVRTRDRTEGVHRAIALLESNPVQGKAVTVKPNFNTADPAPGSTHNDTLRSLVLTLKNMGATRVTLAERCGPYVSTREVMEEKGIVRLAEEVGFDIINLEELGDDGWVHLHPKDSHWKDGFHFPRAYLEAESIVQTCCLKTHAYGGHFTLSLKNSVGTVAGKGYPYMCEMHMSPHMRKMIAEINTAYSPDLILLDGVDAFVKGGPDKGTRAEANVILGGSDRVAIDAVGVAILRLLGTTREVSEGPIFQQEQIARAVELGLGVKSSSQIQLVTDDAESEAFAAEVREILLAS